MRSPPTKHLVAEMDLMWDIIDKTEEVGECWIWTAYTRAGGYPVMKIRGCGCQLVRRQVFLMNGGELMPRQPVDVVCNERSCVNPAHLEASSIKKIAKKAARRGSFAGPARAAKIAATKRSNAKLSMNDAIEIRLSQEPTKVLASRYGINKSLVNKIKAGDRWKDYSSPFAGLMR